MKLRLVSVTVHGKRFSAFVNVKEGEKFDIEQFYEHFGFYLADWFRGITITVG